jgi:hypothetical protein
MKKPIHYADEPFGPVEVVDDFLPSPDELVFREEGVKVTLSLSKRSVAFFKREAARHDAPYQRMIRRLVDAYAEHYDTPSGAGSRRSSRTSARNVSTEATGRKSTSARRVMKAR